MLSIRTNQLSTNVTSLGVSFALINSALFYSCTFFFPQGTYLIVSDLIFQIFLLLKTATEHSFQDSYGM